ncbi:MAG: Gfo/Idh/MocA family oxidoreductase, partial [Candidatus Dormiibacterota bacterium]
MSGQRARVGLVGAGWWSGHMHLPSLTQNPDAEVVCVCDQDGERARAAAELFGVPRWTEQVGELLALAPDCVIVATPHTQHHAPAAAALDLGIDVMIEKPMTVDPAEAWDLVERARRSGANLHVGYPFVHSPHASELRDAIRAGDLGPLVMTSGLFATMVRELYRGNVESQHGDDVPFISRPTTYSDPAHGGGQLFTQMTHCASLLLWVTELRAREVFAYATAPGQRVDLADALSVSMAGGSIATLATTGSVIDQRERFEEYRFFGSDGMAALDTARGTLAIGRARGPLRASEPLDELSAQP